MLNENWMREIWTITVDLIISFRLVIHLAESEESWWNRDLQLAESAADVKRASEH